jgi:hypothetical protein
MSRLSKRRFYVQVEETIIAINLLLDFMDASKDNITGMNISRYNNLYGYIRLHGNGLANKHLPDITKRYNAIMEKRGN